MTVETAHKPWWVDRGFLDIPARDAQAAHELRAADNIGWSSLYQGRCSVVHAEACDWADIPLDVFAAYAPRHARGTGFDLESLRHAAAHPVGRSRPAFSFDWSFRLVEVDDVIVWAVDDTPPAPGVALVLTLCMSALAEIEAHPEPSIRDRRAEREEHREREYDRCDRERAAALAQCATRAESEQVHAQFLDRLDDETHLTSQGWVFMDDWPKTSTLDLDQPTLW